MAFPVGRLWYVSKEAADGLIAQSMTAILRSVSLLTGWVVVVLQGVDSMCHYLMLFDEK